jgi:hypothetical protein
MVYPKGITRLSPTCVDLLSVTFPQVCGLKRTIGQYILETDSLIVLLMARPPMRFSTTSYHPSPICDPLVPSASFISLRLNEKLEANSNQGLMKEDW